jgi:uncharacterized membrane protein HdeD (DUF308 family)
METPPFESRLWGGLALRGVVAILFGVLAFLRPGGSATALVYLFGAYAIVDGIFALVASGNIARLRGRWAPMMLVGIIGIIIGIFTFARPAATAVGLVYYVAFWALLTGFFEVLAAFRLRSIVPNEWLLVLAGFLSIAFGVLLAARPGAGMLSLVWIIGAYAIIFGALELGLAVRLRGSQQDVAPR